MVIRALEETFDVTLEPGEITEAEKEFRKSYHRMYDNDEWFFQKSTRRRFAELPPGAKVSQFVYKVPGGPILRVNLSAVEGRILDVLITGNMMPSRREIPLGELSAYRGKLDEIAGALEAGDAAALEKIFTRASNARRDWNKN